MQGPDFFFYWLHVSMIDQPLLLKHFYHPRVRAVSAPSRRNTRSPYRRAVRQRQESMMINRAPGRLAFYSKSQTCSPMFDGVEAQKRISLLSTSPLGAKPRNTSEQALDTDAATALQLELRQIFADLNLATQLRVEVK